MLVKVKLYATLGHYTPEGKAGKPFSLELPEDSSLLTLVEKLQVPPEETRVTFVNGIAREMDHKLRDGDEVGIFPPIGGG